MALARAKFLLLSIVCLALASCASDSGVKGGAASSTTAAQVSLAVVFSSPLPAGYAYAEVAADIEERIRAAVEADTKGASSILDEVMVRQAVRGSIPVATVEAIRLNDKATSADRAGIVTGMSQSIGGTPSVIDLGGKSATLVSSSDGVLGIVYASGDIVVIVIGNDLTQVQTVATVATTLL